MDYITTTTDYITTITDYIIITMGSEFIDPSLGLVGTVGGSMLWEALPLEWRSEHLPPVSLTHPLTKRNL